MCGIWLINPTREIASQLPLDLRLLLRSALHVVFRHVLIRVEIARVMKERIPDLTIEFRSSTQLIQAMVDNRSHREVWGAEYHTLSASGAAGLDSELVKSERAESFKGMPIRTCRGMIDEDKYRERIVYSHRCSYWRLIYTYNKFNVGFEIK